MKPEFFGDSYDIVKRSFLHWLRPFGKWAVHPMFTEPVPERQAQEFSRFLGAELLTTEVLTPKTDRACYFRSSHECGHLFLDPDTGLPMNPPGRDALPRYLLRPELVSMTRERPKSLTLVFDQSLGRGKAISQMEAKLSELAKEHVCGFAYLSHVGFILVSADERLVSEALNKILSDRSLLASRITRPR